MFSLMDSSGRTICVWTKLSDELLGTVAQRLRWRKAAAARTPLFTLVRRMGSRFAKINLFVAGPPA